MSILSLQQLAYFFFFKFFLFTYDRHTVREREAETQAEGEAGSMHQEPDVGFDPGYPGSHPGPKAGAKPLRHPGIPYFCYCWVETTSFFKEEPTPVCLQTVNLTDCMCFKVSSSSYRNQTFTILAWIVLPSLSISDLLLLHHDILFLSSATPFGFLLCI